MDKKEPMNNENIETILTKQVLELNDIMNDLKIMQHACDGMLEIKKYKALYEMKSSELFSSFYNKFQSLFFKIDDVAYILANIYEKAENTRE